MFDFEIFAYLGSVVMIMIGLGVAIHAHRSARDTNRRDPDAVKRIIDELRDRL